MAISLNETRKHKKSEEKKVEDVVSSETKTLRPWNSFEELPQQTRTLAAKEATVRAKEIAVDVVEIQQIPTSGNFSSRTQTSPTILTGVKKRNGLLAFFHYLMK